MENEKVRGPVVLVGRSSSHFTRVARMFALELGVDHLLRVVPDLATLDPEAYAGNPALKIPVLIDEHGPLFGVENVCRALVRRSGRAGVVLRGEMDVRVVANAEELVLHAMGAEVALVFARMDGDARRSLAKVRPSLENALDYLDAHVDGVLAALPRARTLSFVEVALFCLVRHLTFREVMTAAAMSRWPGLAAFAADYESREAAVATAFAFDAVAPSPAPPQGSALGSGPT